LPRERHTLDLRAAAAALATAAPGTVPTMSEVARSMRVAKPTLYRLVRSREELVQLCLDAEAERLIGHLHEAVRPTDAPATEALVDAAVSAFAAESPAGFELLFGGRFAEARAAVRRVEDRLAELLRRRGGDAGAADPVAAARLLGAATAGARRAAEPR
jgi:AcrR family transcriptional regulator